MNASPVSVWIAAEMTNHGKLPNYALHFELASLPGDCLGGLLKLKAIRVERFANTCT